MYEPSDLERFRTAAQELHDAAKPLRVLSALAWPQELRERFLASGGEQLPEPTYRPVDPTPTLDLVAQARRSIRPGTAADEWLDSQARAVESTALMLSTVGTPAFHAYSRQLYGVPTLPLRYDPVTPLDLATRIHESIDELTDVNLLAPAVRDRTGADVVAQIEPAVRAHFGDDAPALPKNLHRIGQVAERNTFTQCVVHFGSVGRHFSSRPTVDHLHIGA